MAARGRRGQRMEVIAMGGRIITRIKHVLKLDQIESMSIDGCTTL